MGELGYSPPMMPHSLTIRTTAMALLLVGCAPGFVDAPDLQRGDPTTTADGGLDTPVDPETGNGGADDRRAETQGPACEHSDDCDEGLVCEGNECVPRLYGCRGDDDCHEGAYCDEYNGICLSVCEADDHCPDSTRCANVGVCLQPCDLEAQDCPPGTQCKRHREIASWAFCGTAEEGIRCGPGGTCPVRTRCNEGSGLCDPALACDDDRDCDEDQICEVGTGECIPRSGACTTDHECPDHLNCNRRYRRCLPPGYCERELDCERGQGCHPNANVCVNYCREDRHCGPGRRCERPYCEP
ncbi:MAG: hypothetical protein CMH55_08080 [Myxococcales bacterium]|nr:hypothetical protein [Myxococcales bacterium]